MAGPHLTRLSLDHLRTVSLVLGFFAWEGVFAAMMGQSTWSHKYLIAAAIFAAACYRLMILLLRGSASIYETLSYLLFGLCTAVSIVSNTWVFPQDIRFWLPALYTISPILLLPALSVFGIKEKHILDAIIAVAIGASLLIVADQALQFDFMQVFVRADGLNVERKAVILKTETCLALVILFARWGAKWGVMALWRLGAVCLLAFNLFIVTESRLVMAAVVIALSITILFAFRGRTRVALLALSGIAAAILSPLIFDRFIQQIISFGDTIQQDMSATWRAKTFDYFYAYFQQTNGLGFGVMSAGTEANNLVSWANHFGGLWLGSGTKYPLALADIGILQALVQFGYAGLLLVGMMTLIMSVNLFRSGMLQARPDLFALGALVVGYTLSPLPMNFFTLEWSGMAGNALWAVTAFSAVLNDKRSSTCA